MGRTVFGLAESAWNRFAATQGTTAIGIWLLSTVFYTLWAGRLLSPITAVMVFPGIFVALYLYLAGCLLTLLLPRAASVPLLGGGVLGDLASLVGSYLALIWLHALM